MEKPELRLVAGTDLTKRDANADVDVWRVEEILSAKELDLFALAQELGQFGPVPPEIQPSLHVTTGSQPPHTVLCKQRHGQVSFMITNAQKERLRLMGYDDDAVRGLTPAEAHDILRSRA